MSQSKKWLVTGGLGFIGSAFVRIALSQRKDISITVLDAMTYAANPLNLASIADHPNYHFVPGDICNPEAIDQAIGGGVDAIINFAAETHVDRSILNADTCMQTNIIGTHNLLEAINKHNIQRFLQVSTDEVYGHIESGSSIETDPLRPRSPYAASKASADLLALAYRTTYGTPILITRGSNTYGPYQYPEKLIPLFVMNLLQGNTVPVYGDGHQVRDWLYVDDHARGILHVLEYGALGEIYNLGGGNAHENLEITKRLVELTQRGFQEAVRHVADRPGHDRRYALNSDKALRLGWAPRVPFEEGLSTTVEWYRTTTHSWSTTTNNAFVQQYENSQLRSASR